MDRVRVLHIITRLISGGADENTIFNVEGLDHSRYQVDLAAGEPSEPDVVARLQRTRFLSLPHLQRELRPGKDVLAFWEAVRLIRSHHYQLVHTHEAKAGIVGRLAARYCGVPIIVHTLHGITFHRHLRLPVRALYLALERLAGRWTDLFICVGEDLRQTYIANGIGEPERFVVIRSGFDLARFHEASRQREVHRRALRERLGLPPGTRIVGTAARLEQRKGVQFLLQAARFLRQSHPDVHFTIAGRGPYAPRLLQLATKLGLSDRVHFLGHVHDIDAYLAALDIFVLSSLWEGLPRAVVQARAVGLPVIGFEVEGIREVVRDGQNGFVVPSRDVKGLAQKIDLLLSDPELAQNLGRYDDATHLEQWDRRRMVSEIQALYDRLVEDVQAKN
ncbi:MAG: glycosyltransferase family 4 protein [candidate division KSB1 bacterium]|nr:glycosyltransferase family 4 protein [candidate division KSB1 bacterium]